MYTTLKYDFKLIRHDPMLLLSVFTPIILYLFMTFGFPLIKTWVWNEWQFNISPYHDQAAIAFLCLIPMMIGMVYGFILLDERDEGIITTLSVTPLGKSGYLQLRLAIPLIFSFTVSMLFYYLVMNEIRLNAWQNILTQLVLSLNAPLMLLFLGAFASNKVEGIAISKGFGLLFVAILVDYFAPAPYNWLGAYSPLFWTERCFFAETNFLFVTYLSISILFYGTLILLLYRRFNRSYS